ncbi:hypothetical protein HK104_003527 [Borealophlyctis nickersoniae]|nr:hypothetical protein HK104_003527 [Borealophlyctis nickersoniae]
MSPEWQAEWQRQWAAFDAWRARNPGPPETWTEAPVEVDPQFASVRPVWGGQQQGQQGVQTPPATPGPSTQQKFTASSVEPKPVVSTGAHRGVAYGSASPVGNAEFKAKADGTLYQPSAAFQKLTAPDSNTNVTGIVDSQVAFVRNINWKNSTVAIILIVTGAIMVFAGHKLWKPIWFIAGFYVGGVLAFLLLAAIENRGTNFGDNRDLIYLLVCIFAGIAIGGLFLCLIRFAIFAAGGLLGFVIATAILSMITGGPIQSGAGRALFIAAMVIIFAVLVFVAERPILIISTSFVGAWAIVFGIDVFVNAGLAMAVNDLLRGQGLQGGLNKYVYIELGGFVLLGLVGTLVQFRYGKKEHYSGRKGAGYHKPGMVKA